MVFDNFSTKEELLTLLPMKIATREVDIFNMVERFFVEKRVPLENLVSVTVDGAPAMTGQTSRLFTVQCKGEKDLFATTWRCLMKSECQEPDYHFLSLFHSPVQKKKKELLIHINMDVNLCTVFIQVPRCFQSES